MKSKLMLSIRQFREKLMRRSSAESPLINENATSSISSEGSVNS